jgi:hypothetical protein
VNSVVQQFAMSVGKGGVGRIMHRTGQDRNGVMQKRRREPARGFAGTPNGGSAPLEPRARM